MTTGLVIQGLTGWSCLAASYLLILNTIFVLLLFLFPFTSFTTTLRLQQQQDQRPSNLTSLRQLYSVPDTTLALPFAQKVLPVLLLLKLLVR
jgi:hypothetical protein